MEHEIFSIIEGFDNYAISNLGRVINITTERILKPQLSTKGYYYIKLCQNGVKKHLKIHRLIGIAFIENPESKECIDHIDNNRLNNNILNLRWATYSENAMNMKISTKNISGIKGVFFDKSRNKWRAEIKLDGIAIYIGRYNTLEEAQHARIKRANEIFGNFTNNCEKFI